MAAVAERVGVSRQTVYNEVGTSRGLAEAMILQELGPVPRCGERRVRRAPDRPGRRDPGRVPGRARARSRQQAAPRGGVGHPRRRHRAAPLLTTHAESLLAAAKLVVGERVAPYRLGLDREHLDAAIDMVVRLVLNHVMQPSAAPARTADDIAWIATRVLR